jgi:arylsulfatase A
MSKKSSFPNIIYILADDMGYGDVSCLNENSKITTSNLDSMARDGMIFTDAHSSSAVCTPSRYSIMTGRYNWRSSLKQGVLFGYDKHLIEKGRMTVASMLKNIGYKTACIGKWHLGMDWKRIGEEPEDVDFASPIKNGPVDYGFDYFYGISASLDMPPYVYIENDRVVQIPDKYTEGARPMTFWRKGPTASDFKHEEVLPNFTKKAIDIIDEYNNAPFFLYFPLPAPHTPILPIGKFKGKSNTNAYGDFVMMCDDVVGQIIDKTKEKDIADNTIIIFTSDNGCSPEVNFKELGDLGHNPNYIFRGHKADIYEGGHRIPLIIRWPSQIKGGRVSNEPVCLVDFMATVAEILGIELPDNAGEDSVSNLPIWKDEKYQRPLREAIVHHSIDGSFSIRKGKWKLEMCPGSGGWSYPRPGQEPEDAPPIQLYNLEEDTGELNNLYNMYPNIVQELRELLMKYIDEGRSTPGKPQTNEGISNWPQLRRLE